MLNVRKRAIGAVKCLSFFNLLGMLISASAQAGDTEDERAFLALQKPGIFAVGQEFVEVEFFSGPNLVAYQYTVACYEAEDDVTCGDVLDGEIVPIDSVSGSLPRGYSRVLANMTIPDNTEVDCFVTVGGGPLDAFSKCQLAGDVTTDPLPIPPGFRVAVSSVPGQPDALLVKAEPDTLRNALVESLFPEVAVSSSRSYDVTYKVQCLAAPATACDLSEPLVDGDDVFTTGTLVTGLVPNTDYECFVVVLYDGEAQCTSADSTDVVPTLPSPPTSVVVSNPTFDSLEVTAVAPVNPGGGGAVPVAGYAFQCSLEAECDPDGTWFPSSAPFAADPADPVTVTGLDAATVYNCWAATVAGDSAPYEYSCSVLEQGTTAIVEDVKMAVVQGSPLLRKVMWMNDTTSPSAPATFVSATCCLGETPSTDCATSSASTCVGTSCSAEVNFESLVTGVVDDQTAIDKMTDFASNNFACTMEYTTPTGTEVTSDPATIACGVDGVGALAATAAAPSQITGDPAADGFFNIGSSTQLGTYVRKTAGGSIAPFDLYVTSFIWSDSISTSNGTPQDPSVFEVGDLVIGVGLKSAVANDRGNTGLKVDPFKATATYRPSTVVDVVSNGMGSNKGGECAIGRFNLQVQTTTGLYDHFDSCPTPPVGTPLPRFSFTTATADVTPSLPLLPGNWFETVDETGFEILFKPEDIAAFQDTPGVSFEAGWKFVMYGYFPGPLQTDAVGFGLPLACPVA